ncbi:Phosphoglucomutase-3 [Lobulomyces angularis]|nr:Phosphoglucomutase-3 [Lobulomyces angularis]
MDFTSVNQLNQKYQKHDSTNFVYGTAGFRTLASTLCPVLFRLGMLANLRSRKLNSKIIGGMITASHNPFPDNGIKLVEPLGEMLTFSWEEYATKMANVMTAEKLISVIKEIVTLENIDVNCTANVVVARDTRPSGLKLAEAFIEGVKVLHGNVKDYGVLTTPQLHYLVRCLNTSDSASFYGSPTEDGYYQKLSDAFKTIVDGQKKISPLYVDAANGVGAKALSSLSKVIGSQHFDCYIANAEISKPEKLNFQCGADYVKLEQTGPFGLEIKPNMRCCSLDGDADRIVYFYVNNDNVFKLLDGDKIATLSAWFLIDLIKKSGVKINGRELKIGLVQTAYANGSATQYATKSLKVPVVFTETGVKHLHHEALKYDIGIYFEANGHGTVLFSESAIKAFRDEKGKNESQIKALRILVSFSQLINQAVGDALSDMLLVEAILTLTQTTLESWDSAYKNLPNLQVKVKVTDKNIFKAIKADTELAEPAEVQKFINNQVKNYSRARCFVRPSGTEDVVRIYSEALTQPENEKLSKAVCEYIRLQFGNIESESFEKSDGAVSITRNVSNVQHRGLKIKYNGKLLNSCNQIGVWVQINNRSTGTKTKSIINGETEIFSPSDDPLDEYLVGKDKNEKWDVQLAFVDINGNWDSKLGQNYHFSF